MSTQPKRKEAPTEPLKRAIGLCVRVDQGPQRAEVPDFVRDRVRGDAEVFADQSIANALHAGAMRGIRAGVDCEIALRVDTHGAARDVGGSDPHEPIVDDHHLRMYERGDVAGT